MAPDDDDDDDAAPMPDVLVVPPGGEYADDGDLLMIRVDENVCRRDVAENADASTMMQTTTQTRMSRIVMAEYVF
jgi:hypothetical protein